MKRAKALRIENEYGLSEEKYYEIFNEQEGRCAICGNSLDNPHIDHDHITGKVRGILCPGCNWGLGSFGDSPEVLRKAASYIADSRLYLDIDNSMYEEVIPSSRKVPEQVEESSTNFI
jgi:Recombination endonuclease VII